MLIMKCPECSKYINSGLLAEVSTITCEHCGKEVTVHNVLISANGFTFDRNDLLKRFYRYRKLLDEVLDERDALANNPQASIESKRSIDKFLTIIQGMMSGARENYRHEFEVPLACELDLGQARCSGKFLNLSMEGACLSISGDQPLPRVDRQLQIRFSLPERKDTFKIAALVCWAQKARPKTQSQHLVGTTFKELDEGQRILLWDFISSRAGQAKR